MAEDTELQFLCGGDIFRAVQVWRVGLVPLAEQGFCGLQILFRAVAQTVGFGLGMRKMLDLTMGID